MCPFFVFKNHSTLLKDYLLKDCLWKDYLLKDYLCNDYLWNGEPEEVAKVIGGVDARVAVFAHKEDLLQRP